MPSKQLAQLCQHIENQDTDHFGKFYMYVSLLNTLTVRDKTFADGLPQYSGRFWRSNPLHIGGELPVDFTRELNAYRPTFTNAQPHWSTALNNSVMAYLRKGKISDLSHIIDQMLHHLMAISNNPSHNRSIYDDINFKTKKFGLIKIIEQVSALNNHLLSTNDSGCNTALSLLAVGIGLTLVIASIISSVSLILGLSLVVGGAYGAYHFLTQTIAQVNELERQIPQLSEHIKGTLTDDSLLGDAKNHSAFYVAAIKPLPYAAITAIEQLVHNNEQQNELAKYRQILATSIR